MLIYYWINSDPALGLLIYLMLDVTLQLCHLVHVRFGCSSSSLAVFTLIVYFYSHAYRTLVDVVASALLYDTLLLLCSLLGSPEAQ